MGFGCSTMDGPLTATECNDRVESKACQACEELSKRVDAEAVQIYDVAARLERVADQLFGAGPKKENTLEPSSVPNGTLDTCFRTADGLRRVRERLQAAASRF